jgi:hypothetical protein
MPEQEKHPPAAEASLLESACGRHSSHPDGSRETSDSLEGYSLDTLTALLDE